MVSWGWHYFYEYIRLEVDRKDVAYCAKAHIKELYKGNKKERDFLLSGPEWVYGTSYAFVGLLTWRGHNEELPEGWDFERVQAFFINRIREACETKAERDIEEAKKPKKISKSPMEIIREKTSEFIGECEYALDTQNPEWSVYDKLKIMNAASNIARATYDHYIPLRDELLELNGKKPDPDLVEGYSHLKVKERKALLAYVQNMMDDAERYMESKKATRKATIKTPKSAEKQIEKVVYLKESNEYKVTSIHPVRVVGSERVFLFNEKERYIIELKTNSGRGLEISGTTIKNIDMGASRATRLRKPMEFLPIVLSKTPLQIDKEWKKLTTKPASFTGRINKHTVILKVFDK